MLAGNGEMATTLKKGLRLPPGSQLRGHGDLTVLMAGNDIPVPAPQG